MKLRYKVLNGILVVLLVAVGSLAFIISRTDDCPDAPVLAGDTVTMKAIVRRCYGSADVLEYVDVAIPEPAANEVLIKVKAAAVNPLDWHYMRGSPYLMRLGTGLGSPDMERLGVDVAGTVTAVGADVTRFQPGDDVFGGVSGAFAEFVVVPEDYAIVHKPAAITFEQAASTPIAALTALQALRDHGQLEPGQKVLVNGASGGVGTFAVQIAKWMGADASGVCSTRNVDMVRSIGADRVFDYKREDYRDSGEQFDLIVDMVGNHSLLSNRRVMTEDGRLVIVGGAKGDWVSPFLRPLAAMSLQPFVSQDFPMIIAEFTQEDLVTVGELIASGDVEPVIDRRYRLHEVPDAIRYSESGRARGKIIISLE
ncbi:MAG: NAD(P)-dependent alcohol dehydrogenase [Woeseiaceae bacterium]|nr:NAD(P)-dependent alcohol dehydrogenase [Woeseiaceae bacterium]